MNALVIGGTLFIGRLLVKRLLEEDCMVAVLHRTPEHDLGGDVENLSADRGDAASLHRVLSGRHFDVVFDNVYDWERGTTAQQVVDTVRESGAGLYRYVFMSSVAAYGDGLDRHEDHPLAPDDHPEPYVANKAATERALLEMHRTEGLPVVTLRPPYVYGPGNPFYREAFFWDRMADHRPIIVPGDGSRLMQFALVNDIVEACIRAMDVDAANGHAFNIANPAAVTQTEVVHALARAAGAEPKLVNVPRERITANGGDVMDMAKLYFGFYFDMPPITQVIDKARDILGFEPTPFDEGLRQTYAWYRENHRRPAIDYSFEDRLLS
ncbi:MAG: NAD-dependent epimerase/dehydratase family protein [bacterium]|nr:NAD-dependent epimerase/dehydratase family protein [bacterium]